MKRPAKSWIWRQASCPTFSFDGQAIANDLAEACRLNGVIEGKAAAVGLSKTSDVALDAMADEVLATAATRPFATSSPSSGEMKGPHRGPFITS